MNEDKYLNIEFQIWGLLIGVSLSVAVSSSPGTCFSKTQIWPKSAVNRVLNVLYHGYLY